VLGAGRRPPALAERRCQPGAPAAALPSGAFFPAGRAFADSSR
jgi:hypothetical protein